MEEIAKVIAAVIPLVSAETVLYYIEKVLEIIKIILFAVITLKLGKTTINKLFASGANIPVQERRIVTLRSILHSLLKYSVYFVSGYMLIKEFYKNADAILAGAGIVGLAVGFGAQNLVRDVITGFFILLEDQFAVGEYVTAAGVSGIVEEMGFRVTKLRDFTGELHIVPNGIIQQVTNHHRGSMRALVDVTVAYEEDVDKAIAVLQEVAQQVKAGMEEIIVEGPEVLGVVSVQANGITIRMIARTKPMEQWRVEREIRRIAKLVFDREGMQLPYPKQVTIVGEQIEHPEVSVQGQGG